MFSFGSSWMISYFYKNSCYFDLRSDDCFGPIWDSIVFEFIIKSILIRMPLLNVLYSFLSIKSHFIILLIKFFPAKITKEKLKFFSSLFDQINMLIFVHI
jgi:hypothetical protein